MPFLRMTWTDPITGKQGYAVIDRLIHGICGGGLRMRAGVTMDEVEGLARTMSIKKGIMKAVGGGAKGGIDCDPADPDARLVLTNFIRSLSPLFATCWSTGEDLGVRQEDLNEIFSELGLGFPNQATINRTPDPLSAGRRMAVAAAVKVDRVELSTNIGGYGVAQAVAAASQHCGWDVGGLTAVIQGFGSMGGAAARYLTRLGVKVVGIADVSGLVANKDGLDVESLFWSRSARGDIDRSSLRAADRQLPRDEWVALDADVLVPAALGDALNETNCDRVRARLVVEAANLPTTPEARRRLHERGVTVIPDFVANSGTSAWFTWVTFGEVAADAEDSFAKLRAVMWDNVTRVLELVRAKGLRPDEAGVEVALENIREMERHYGQLFPVVRGGRS